MLSARLVHLIEEHEDDIARRVIAEIGRHPEMHHLRTLSDAELRETGHNILNNLGHWLSGKNEEEIARHYEQLGRTRFDEAVPLRESVRGLCIIREKMLDFVEEHQLNRTPVELYAEEELTRRVGRFFDLLICHLVTGYERALRREQHAHA